MDSRWRLVVARDHASAALCADDQLLHLDPQEECNRTKSWRVQCWLRDGGKLRCFRDREHFYRPRLRLARPALRNGICRDLPLLHVYRPQIPPPDYITHDVSC